MLMQRVRLATPGIVIALVVLATVIALAASRSSTPAGAAAGDGGFVDHPGLVPDSPENGYPIILETPTRITFEGGNCGGGCLEKKQTKAVDLIGDYIVSGGDFVTIEVNGQNITQPWLAVFDTRDKSLACQNLDVDGEVLAIAPTGERNTAIIAGRFKKATGANGVELTRTRIAKVNFDTCSVDTAWNLQGINSKVTELAVSGNRLFIGGDFTSIGGEAVERVAEANLSTGVVNPNFDFVFAGELGTTIKALEVNPAGTRLGIVHKATSIAGQSMRGSAIFNIANQNNPSLTNHRMATNLNAYSYYNDIQDGAFSPDFQHVAIVQGTATVSDYVHVLPTTEAAGQFKWVKFMRDSSFSVGMTNDTVYVGGHFCKIDTGPGATQVMAPNSGPDTCTGVFFAGGAWRTQLAALSMDNGTPLTWNPGNDALRGASAITVVSRGLLVGFDGDRTDDIRTGTTAFFDFGGPLQPPVDPPVDPPPADDQTCTATFNANGSASITWTTIDGETTYVVRKNGSYLATIGNALSYTDPAAAAADAWIIRSKQGGVTTNTTCDADGNPPVDPPPAGDQTCTVTFDGNGADLAWTSIDGEDEYIVRRNGSYLANVGNDLAYTDPGGDANDTWIIRSRMNGATTNTTCSADGNPPPADGCTRSVNGGQITLTWSAFNGENDDYKIKVNGTTTASVSSAGALTWTGPFDANVTYAIRSNEGGVKVTVDCE
jgi:hypothetical protein